MHRQVLCSLFVVALSACSPPASERDDEIALESTDFAKRGGAHADVRAVPIALGTALSVELAPASPRVLFSFALPAPARVRLATQAVVGGPELDTVLALRRADTTRGSGHEIAENDDSQGARFSLLERALPPGDYRIEVRGQRARVRGAFTLSTSCVGAGCPVLPTPCPFGEQFADLREHPDLAVVDEAIIVDARQLSADVERAQLVRAVQQSSHSDVRDVSEALARVDQQQIRRLALHERSGPGTYIVFEYGVGDNSYGAIFASGSSELLASIHDGDLIDCHGGA